MAIKPIVKLGDKQLATPSIAVKNFATPELFNILQDMQDTMKEKGGVGIAAPQIGHNLRIVLFGFEKNARYPNEKPVPTTILINPIIEILSEETSEAWEGCLSIPGMRGLVTRYNHIQYQGYDPHGNFFSREADGFHARMVQHECDHLDGILFPQRIKDMRFFGFEEELRNSNLIT